MKKFLLAVLSLITILGLALGLAGCNNSATAEWKFSGTKKSGTPVKIEIQKSLVYSQVIILDESEDINNLHKFFSSVSYEEGYDMASDTDDFLYKGLNFRIFFDDASEVRLFVVDTGKALCEVEEKYFISYEKAVDYSAVCKFINNLGLYL